MFYKNVTHIFLPFWKRGGFHYLRPKKKKEGGRFQFSLLKLKNLENRVLSGWKIKIHFSQNEVSLLEWDDPQIVWKRIVTHFFSRVRQWTLHGWDDAIFNFLFHSVPMYTGALPRVGTQKLPQVLLHCTCLLALCNFWRISRYVCLPFSYGPP